jgi:imidazolonepropionase-like amidohydrolase
VNTLLAISLTISSAFAVEGVRVEVGDGTVLERVTVVVDDKGRVAAVGKDVKVPKGAERIDGNGRVLTPGLIETRGVLGLMELWGEKSTNEHAMGSGGITPAFRTADGFNPASTRIAIEREEGVTSTIATPSGGIISGQGYWFDLVGTPAAAPDTKKPTAMFGRVDRWGAGSVGSRGALWLKLREIFDDARFYKKNKAAYDRASARDLSLPRVHLEALLLVVDKKLPLVLGANRAQDIRAALTFAREQKIDLVLKGGAEAWLVADELKKAGVPVIVTPSVQGPKDFDQLRARDDLAAVLRQKGVNVVISANGSWDQNARRVRQEAGYAVANGYPRKDVLRAITLAPAQVFGKGKELGTVAKGKRANLVLWSGDPLELSTIAERVWIDGEPMSLHNRQRALAERYQKRKR